ncbi:unnamed protein product [Tilletia controversa]|uniref:Fe2OG dioxygenase domain-containing protein n=3 Tax=Tilletia TaxID=13289 RepID=A0A8X7MVK1_9BASI|nr:hypothetical protein CF336_g2423 [Tilletia laevis]KAE8202072.1 hypothetical protein CF328_g2433 [Tilletia controversa]KAE8262932.1 hypothetical protein A4X03_0g2070 [Tilletia caries]KAE8206517.1 hypothetical protein CF335_g1828 [Tilletia laevis]KAE8250936.1 hypothetical protein A4X06_0g2884 [Tilletia controversa]
MSSKSNSVPFLDYALWAGPSASPASREQFASELRRVSVLGLGFFVLTNSPLDQGGRRERQFDFSRRFFALPLEARQTVSMDHSRHFRGYAKLGDEYTKGLQDLRDQLECGLDREPFPGVDRLSQAQVAAQPYLNLNGPNQFLDEDTLPGHRASTTEWLDVAREVNLQLTIALEVALGLAPDALVGILGDSPADRLAQRQAEAKFAITAQTDHEARYDGPLPYFRAKMIRYPRSANVDGFLKADASSTQGVGPHKDGGWITLLATDSTGGLQVQDFSGGWIDVPHSNHGIIVNFGQQIEKLTRGAVQAATHRVQIADNPESLPDRYSVAFFSMPSMTSQVHALPLSDLSPELINAWRTSGRADAPGNEEEEQGRRHKGTLVSDVPAGDLYGNGQEEFGILAWRGITRSHPTVAARWHQDLVPWQEL